MQVAVNRIHCVKVQSQWKFPKGNFALLGFLWNCDEKKFVENVVQSAPGSWNGLVLAREGQLFCWHIFCCLTSQEPLPQGLGRPYAPRSPASTIGEMSRHLSEHGFVTRYEFAHFQS